MKTPPSLLAGMTVGGEQLSIGTMTASAKGTAEKPGKTIKQKAGLNRAIPDAAPEYRHC